MRPRILRGLRWHPAKISIIVVSGAHERLQMAAMLASVGAVSGNDVSVFLSMNALPYFVKGSDRRAPAGRQRSAR